MKAKAGDTIVFDTPIEFADGNTYKELKLIEQSKFIEPESGRKYWVTNWRKFRYLIKREGEPVARPDNDNLNKFRIWCPSCCETTKYDVLDTVTGEPCDKCGAIL